MQVHVRDVLPRSVVASNLRDVDGDPTRVTPDLVDRYFDLATRAGTCPTKRIRCARLRQCWLFLPFLTFLTFLPFLPFLPFLYFLSPSRTAKPPGSPVAGRELLHHLELHLHDGHDDHLGDALARFDRESRLAAIPARNHDLPLVVGVDQADEIAEHDAVLVAQT
jgi:hypothetical protein